MGVMRFAVCFEAHRKDFNVWAVKAPLGDIDDDQDWQLSPSVLISVPVTTIYRGPQAKQPRAYLTGVCHAVMRDDDGELTII